jgi:RNA polymerase sigma factor (sigma-70 family)
MTMVAKEPVLASPGVGGARPVRGDNTETNVENVQLAAEVFASYEGFIRAVICLHVKDEARRDDIFQSLFLSLVHKPIPQNVTDTKAYLYKVIVHDAVDTGRRAESYQKFINKYSKSAKYSINKDPVGNAVIQRDQRDKVFELIESRLPSTQSEALDLCYRHNHDLQQVADKMGVNVRTVSSYISIGIKKIRRLLATKEGDYYERF